MGAVIGFDGMQNFADEVCAEECFVDCFLLGDCFKYLAGGFTPEEVESAGGVGGHVGSPVLLDKRSNDGCG